VQDSHFKQILIVTKSETNELAMQKKMITLNRKQTLSIQSSTQTHMDLWNSAMGDSLQLQNQNPPVLSDPF
jgi:hypothetical protein